MASRGDTFVEVSSNTTLASHTPTGTDAGTGWSLEEQTGTTLERVNATNDQAESDGNENNQRHLYTLQPNPAVAEYDTVITLNAVTSTSTNFAGLIARLTDASNYYGAGCYGASAAADKKLFKVVAGTRTELASGDSGNAAGDVLKLEIRNNSQKFYKNGGLELSATDTALTSAGRTGYG